VLASQTIIDTHFRHRQCLLAGGGNAHWQGQKRDPVACSFGEDMPKAMPMILLGYEQHSVRMEMLLAVNEEGKRNTVMSAYPECDGSEVNVKITAIHEWAAGVEATLEGEVLGDAQRPVAFFDTRYVAYKGKYEVGKTYKFKLSAFAYSSEIVPAAEREFRIEGEDAVKRRKHFARSRNTIRTGIPNR